MLRVRSDYPAALRRSGLGETRCGAKVVIRRELEGRKRDSVSLHMGLFWCVWCHR
jgi:hypothetical protein